MKQITQTKEEMKTLGVVPYAPEIMLEWEKEQSTNISHIVMSALSRDGLLRRAAIEKLFGENRKP